MHFLKLSSNLENFVYQLAFSRGLDFEGRNFQDKSFCQKKVTEQGPAVLSLYVFTQLTQVSQNLNGQLKYLSEVFVCTAIFHFSLQFLYFKVSKSRTYSCPSTLTRSSNLRKQKKWTWGSLEVRSSIITNNFHIMKTNQQKIFEYNMKLNSPAFELNSKLWHRVNG